MSAKKSILLVLTLLLAFSALGTGASKAQAQDSAAAARNGCEAAFEDVQDFTASVFANSTSEINDGIIAWDSTDWENIVRRLIGASEFYLNNCIDTEQPLVQQPEALAQFTEMSFLQSPLSSVHLGGNAGSILLVSNFEPRAEWMDLNGDNIDELLLHTQVPYFSEQTMYSIQGGLTIAFFNSEDGWQGQVIAPIASFVTTQEGDHASYAMLVDNTLSVDEVHQALRYFPASTVEVFFADDGRTPLTAITLHTLTGPGEAKELNVLSWNGRIPSVELRVAFDDWCYPGRSLDWEIRNDGSVYIPSNGGEADSPLHCGRTPEALYVWQDGNYHAASTQGVGTFQPMDRSFGYHFEYPIQTHSVRTSNVMDPAAADVAFGALIAVEPNDSYLYGDGSQPTYLTRMRVLAGFNAEQVADNTDLTQFLGTSPLLEYDPTSATIEHITLGGQPAVRAVGIPVVPGEGMTEIIAMFDGLLYEIVIEPAPLQLGFDPNNEIILDPVYDSILNSWVFEMP